MAVKKANQKNKKQSSEKLTNQQDLFCREYAVDYNGTQAAIRAGYSEKTARSQASRLLANENILARVRAIQKERLDKLGVTQDTVLLNIIEVYNRCMQSKPVMEWNHTEKKYVETGKYTFDSKGALKAMELIGKHLAMFNKTNDKGNEKEPITVVIESKAKEWSE